MDLTTQIGLATGGKKKYVRPCLCICMNCKKNMDSQQDSVYEERTMTSIICDNKIIAHRD